MKGKVNLSKIDSLQSGLLEKESVSCKASWDHLHHSARRSVFIRCQYYVLASTEPHRGCWFSTRNPERAIPAVRFIQLQPLGVGLSPGHTGGIYGPRLYDGVLITTSDGLVFPLIMHLRIPRIMRHGPSS